MARCFKVTPAIGRFKALNPRPLLPICPIGHPPLERGELRGRLSGEGDLNKVLRDSPQGEIADGVEVGVRAVNCS
jgi:hypothetical protein